MFCEAPMYEDLERILLSKEEIQARVRELGKQITADYRDDPPVLVGILKGAIVFFSDLIRSIELPLTIDFMAVSSYGSSTKSSGVVKIIKDLDHAFIIIPAVMSIFVIIFFAISTRIS